MVCLKDDTLRFTAEGLALRVGYSGPYYRGNSVASMYMLSAVSTQILQFNSGFAFGLANSFR